MNKRPPPGRGAYSNWWPCEQLNYMNTIESNPFIAEECDVMEACPNELVIEEDEDDDEDIVID